MSSRRVTNHRDYRLPSTVESIQQGWLISCQGSTITSGLLAMISVLLLILVKMPNIAGSEAVSQKVDLLGYISLIFNVSACASCFIIVDRLGDVPYRAIRQGSAPKSGVILPAVAMKVYGIGIWRWAIWHWLICFLLGFFTIVAQILWCVWIAATGTNQAVAVSCLGGFCLLPWIAFIFAPFMNGFRRVYVKDEGASLDSGDQSQSALPYIPISSIATNFRVSPHNLSP